MISLLLLALLSQDVTQDLEKADEALNSGKFDTAIELYTKVFKQDPKQVDCLVGRSRAKLGKKDFDGAIEDASLAIKSGAISSHVFVYRAMAKRGKKDLDGAVVDLRWAIVADPSNVHTYLLKASYREEAGDLDGAIEDCSDAIQINGRKAEVWHERADLKRKKGNPAGAVKDYSKAVELEPDNLEHYYGRALSSIDNSSYDPAIQDLHKVLEFDPKHFPATYFLGVAAGARKDRAGAVDWYSKALALQPDNVQALVQRAALEIELGRLDAAIADSGRALKLSPDDAGAVYRRATALTGKGEWKEAIAAYARLKEVFRKDWGGADAMLAVLPELAAESSAEPVAKRLTDRARALIAKKSYGAAIGILEEVIQLDVRAKAAYELLAQAHDERDDNTKFGDHVAAIHRAFDVVELGQGLSPSTRRIILKRSSMVLGGLLWLARHQSADGRWSADGFGEACGKDGSPRCEGKGRSGNDLRATSLVLLAFLGAGYSQLSKDDYGEGSIGKNVTAGLAWLLRHQNADGSFGDPKSDRFIRDHALATIAMSEAYGMTAAESCKIPAAKAVAFLISVKIRGAGWPRVKADAAIEAETTGWALLALWSAQMSEIAGAREELKEALEMAQSSVLGEKPLEGSLGELLVLSAMACTRSLGKDPEPRLDKQVPDAADPIRLYVGTLAVRFGGKDDRWKSWKDRIKPIVVTAAPAIGDNLCVAGSWNPDPKEGRLMATAFDVLTLELYYGYVNAFGSASELKDEK
jgi:tetratricopeptide (TPR) repeat protein